MDQQEWRAIKEELLRLGKEIPALRRETEDAAQAALERGENLGEDRALLEKSRRLDVLLLRETELKNKIAPK